MKITIALSFILLPVFGHACLCPPPAPINKSSADQYDVIFYGRVDSVSPCNTKGFATAYFTIEELYKGEISRQTKVDFECQSDCMMTIVKNEEWLMYVKYQRFDVLKAEFCDRNRRFYSDPSKDVVFLSTQKSFEEEKALLKELLGLKPFAEKDGSYERQPDMAHQNQKPSAMGKLWLLLTSLAVMLIIFYFTRRKKP